MCRSWMWRVMVGAEIRANWGTRVSVLSFRHAACPSKTVRVQSFVSLSALHFFEQGIACCTCLRVRDVYCTQSITYCFQRWCLHACRGRWCTLLRVACRMPLRAACLQNELAVGLQLQNASKVMTVW